MHISVLTPDEEYFQGEIESVTVPGSAGEFQVLPNHAAIVSSLSAGKVEIREVGGKQMVIEITGGFIEVLSDAVSLLVDGINSKN